jgi:hypothetical protein
MKRFPYVVMTRELSCFDDRAAAIDFARTVSPAVVLERRVIDGRSILVEIARNDWLYDEERGEWRVMLAQD